MPQINLTEEQIRNLSLLLNRAQIQGNEAQALIQLQIVLNRALTTSNKAEEEKGENKKSK